LRAQAAEIRACMEEIADDMLPAALADLLALTQEAPAVWTRVLEVETLATCDDRLLGTSLWTRRRAPRGE
jgi:hypothetical protein